MFFSHQGLSQCSNFIKKNNLLNIFVLIQLVQLKTISKKKIKSEAAIASSLSAKIYNLKILAPNIENEKGMQLRFLIMGKEVYQPDLEIKDI